MGAIRLLIFSTLVVFAPRLFGQLDFLGGDVIAGGSSHFVSGDFDDDGLVDFLVLSQGQVSVLAGNGQGEFENLSTLSIPGGINLPVLADVDGDGHLDAISTDAQDRVTTLFGDGDGNFTVETSLVMGPEPYTFVAGDFDGDSIVDLAVANNGETFTIDGNIKILRGDGTGAFEEIQEIVIGASIIVVPQTADFDGDGSLDLVGACYHPTEGYPTPYSFVLFGDGNGQFGPSEVPDLQYVRLLADVDQDGNTDLIGLHNSQDLMAIAYGDGAGNFTVDLQATLDHPNRVRVGDFNEDGINDLVMNSGNPAPRLFSTLLGDGNGNFSPVLQFGVESGGRLEVADWTGDGHLDIAAWTCGLAIWAGFGDGNLEAHTSVPTAPGPRALAAADFNSDGVEDLVTVGNADISVLLSQGPEPSYESSNIAFGGQLWNVVTDDFDDDGDSDFAVAGTTLTSYLGDGLGGFNQSWSEGQGNANGLAAGDFDEDGLVDLVVSIPGFYDPGELKVYLGDGAGGFALDGTYLLDNQGGVHIAIGDLDDDGHLDVVSANNTNLGAIAVLLGAGDGTFGDFTVFEPGTAVSFLEVVDLNLDGSLDVVAVAFALSESAFMVLYGDGAGNLSPPVTFPANDGPWSVSVADFDDDGHLDLALPRTDFLIPRECLVDVYLGDGTGEYDDYESFVVGTGPWGTIARDLDGDGRLDLATANTGSDDVTILLNRTEPIQFRRGDCNGNGQTDIVDAIHGLNVLFIDGIGPAACLDACDVNDLGNFDIADMIHLLTTLFQGGGPIPPPVTCGEDPTPDTLDCSQFDACP